MTITTIPPGSLEELIQDIEAIVDEPHAMQADSILGLVEACTKRHRDFATSRGELIDGLRKELQEANSKLASWKLVQDYFLTRGPAHTLDHLKRNIEPEINELRAKVLRLEAQNQARGELPR